MTAPDKPHRMTLVALAAVIAGLLLHAVESSLPAVHLWTLTPQLVVTELGTAAIIAGLLALGLDRYLRTRAVEEVAREAARGVENYYLTAGLPPSFAEEVQYIRDLRLIRKNYLVRAWFRNTPDSSDTMLVEYETSYTAVNYSSRAIPHSFRIHLDKGGSTRPNEILSVSLTGADLGADQEFASTTVTSRFRDTWLIYEQELSIPPNSRDPQNRLSTRIRRSIARAEGLEAIVLTEPVLGITVRIEEKPEDLDVAVEIGHRKEPETVRVPPEKPIEWRLDEAFLPWSGVYIIWDHVPQAT